MAPDTPEPGRALERLPAVDDPEIQRIARIGLWLAAAEKPNPNANELGAAAALRLMLARELGLPLRAASELSMIRGRLVVSAKLLRALARHAGYRVVRVAESAQGCTAAVVQISTGEEIGRSTFTLEDAKRAGLVKGGGAWETYPARMLWARASTWAVNDHLPDISLGLVSVDEAAEIEGEIVVETDEPEPEPVQEQLEEPAAGE